MSHIHDSYSYLPMYLTVTCMKHQMRYRSKIIHRETKHDPNDEVSLLPLMIQYLQMPREVCLKSFASANFEDIYINNKMFHLSYVCHNGYNTAETITFKLFFAMFATIILIYNTTKNACYCLN